MDTKTQRCRPFWASLFAVCAATIFSWSAQAQTVNEPRNFSAERFTLSLDRDGMLGIEWAEVPAHLAWDISLAFWGVDDPLVVGRRDASGTLNRTGDIVGTRIGGSLAAAFSLFEWIQLGIEIPFSLYQDRGQNLLLNTATGERLESLGRFGVGAIRIAPKIRLLRQSEQGVGLSLVPNLILPALSKKLYLGREKIVIAPELLLSRSISIVRLALNLGYRFNEFGGTTELFTLRVEDEVFARLGFGLDFDPLEVELTFSFAISADALAGSDRTLFDLDNQNHVESMAGIRYNIGSDIQVFGALGLGLLEGYGTPDYRALAGIRYAPRTSDRDQDGLQDPVDACPDRAEDKDGFKDHDGCPDPDNDMDGVTDSLDQCPLVAEDPDDFEDQDGCPDPDNDQDKVLDVDDECPIEVGVPEERGCPILDRDADGVPDRVDNCPDEPGLASNQGCQRKQLVVIQDNKLQILDKVYFATGSSKIRRRSFRLLKNIARVLEAHPEIENIQIEGHTDSRGSARLNLRLSQKRADSVRRFLINRSIDEMRLEAIGYGEEEPIKSNNRKAGRSANRRVEFVIVTGKEEAEEEAK